MNSKFLLVSANSLGYEMLFAIELGSGDFSALIDTGSNTGLIRIPGTNIFYIMQNSLTTPDDIYTFTFSDGELEDWIEVTFENEDILDRFELSSPDYIEYESTEETMVQGWFLYPYGWTRQSSHSWPLVVLIHGGPQGAWNDGWSYRWNPQLWAGAGFATVMLNIHGSSGFGQEFTDAVSGNWGGVPFQDILIGVEHVLEKYSWVDKDNIFACGASYGGYMINWILGQETPFKALVVHDGMHDTRMGYFATEEIWFPEWEFKGKPWTKPQNYKIWNPEEFVVNWKTPTLIVHGGRDFRIPVTQGIATFTTLQRLGVPSELLYFPDENHWVLKPSNGIKWYQTVLGFLIEWSTK